MTQNESNKKPVKSVEEAKARIKQAQDTIRKNTEKAKQKRGY